MAVVLPFLTRGITAAIVQVLAALALLTTLAPPAAAAWDTVNCSGSGFAVTPFTRDYAVGRSNYYRYEGYEWGGGCYKLNDVDDTPGAPNSGGEGNDCSGYTVRMWGLDLSFNNTSFWNYSAPVWVHGNITTATFYNPIASHPFHTIGKTYGETLPMDAFVYRQGSAGHIGMIYSEGSGGSDYITEAKSDALGTGLWIQTYRSQSAYRGVAREGWPG